MIYFIRWFLNKENTVKAHKNGIINNGFVLNEKGLRRIIDTTKEQLTKAGSGDIYQEYTVKYGNGAIEVFDEIESVLDLDNSGSSKICSLSMKLGIKGQDYTVELTFSDPNEEVKTDAIHYSITGTDRDWLFVTISQIEDRISPIERNKKWALNASISDFMTVFSIGLMLSFFYVFLNLNNDERVYSFDYEKSWKDFVEVEYNVHDELKALSINKPELKPIEVFYEYEMLLKKGEDIKLKAIEKRDKAASKWVKEQRRSKLKVEYKLIMMFMGGFISTFILYVYIKLIKSIYPIYVFCWGDNKDQFGKVEARRKTILIGVCLSFVVSVLASLFVNLI